MIFDQLEVTMIQSVVRPKGFDKPIYVTQPFLPPIEEFQDALSDIWESKWLTNNGPLVQKFQSMLGQVFDDQSISLVNNGTLGLQIALQSLGIAGEVITTPYSFVASTHALFWNKVRPVFCDIEEEYFTIDASKVEDLISPWTTAILGVHVYGNPCNDDALRDIARRHNIKLIYDAAHAFGVRVHGKSIANFGDLSVFSFHATKVFHSIEGGALVSNNKGVIKESNYLKNFGFENETEVVLPGTNAKMNEFQALMGICTLRYFDKIVDSRRELVDVYRKLLSTISGIKLVKELPDWVQYNYSYMPILIIENEFGCSRDQLYFKLREFNIFARRYFYPIISEFYCYRKIQRDADLGTALRISEQVITLPIFPDLKIEDVERICIIIAYVGRQKI